MLWVLIQYMHDGNEDTKSCRALALAFILASKSQVVNCLDNLVTEMGLLQPAHTIFSPGPSLPRTRNDFEWFLSF